MAINSTPIKAEGIRFSVQHDGRETGRATLYLLRNDLHDRPFGLLEDVFVEEWARGSGIGTKLVTHAIREAQARGCYKLVATGRYERGPMTYVLAWASETTARNSRLILGPTSRWSRTWLCCAPPSRSPLCCTNKTQAST